MLSYNVADLLRAAPGTDATLPGRAARRWRSPTTCGWRSRSRARSGCRAPAAASSPAPHLTDGDRGLLQPLPDAGRRADRRRHRGRGAAVDRHRHRACRSNRADEPDALRLTTTTSSTWASRSARRSRWPSPSRCSVGPTAADCACCGVDLNTVTDHTPSRRRRSIRAWPRWPTGATGRTANDTRPKERLRNGSPQATRLARAPGRPPRAPRADAAAARGVPALPPAEAAPPRLPELRLVRRPRGRAHQAEAKPTPLTSQTRLIAPRASRCELKPDGP